MANTLNLGTDGNWATKKDSLLGYNSENGNFKPLAFNFERNTSATRVNKEGLIETVGSGEPRVDYKDDSKGALKLEPSRSNRVTYSEDFSNSSWNKTSGATITSSYGISPSGLQNSTRLQLSTSNEQIYIGIGTHSGNTEVASLYIKGVSGETVQFGVGNNIGQGNTITLDGNWQRIYQESTSGTVLIIGNKDATATDFEIWGAQLEVGSYPTSYIPTQGGVVTRNQDSCNNGANEQVINSTEGVLYFEGSAIANDGTFKRISVGTSDNLFANSIQLRYNTADNSISYQFRVGNVYQADITTTINSTNINKIACVWETNRFEIWINGIKKAEDTSGSVPPSNTFNSLFFGKSSIGLVEPFKGNVKDLRVYNTALTDQELINLTTI